VRHTGEYRVQWKNPRGQLRERSFTKQNCDFPFNAAVNFAAKFHPSRVCILAVMK
jgi:hypothetical protein